MSNFASIYVTTWYVLTDSGQILHGTDKKESPGPKFLLIGSETGNLAVFRHDVGEPTRRLMEAITLDEPPWTDPDSPPIHCDEYVHFLAREGTVTEFGTGGRLLYAFPEVLNAPQEASLVDSDTPEGRDFLANLPPGNQFDGWRHPVPGHIDAPWCMTIHEGAIASIVETVRIGNGGAECGVTTAPSLRSRGFASAAVAGWASLPSLQGRSLFYCTNRQNVSSQRVAQRLGLKFIGSIFTIT